MLSADRGIDLTGAGLGVRTNFGETEVQNLRMSMAGDKNIWRFDITMHDAFAMGGVKSIGDFEAEVDCGFGGKRAS